MARYVFKKRAGTYRYEFVFDDPAQLDEAIYWCTAEFGATEAQWGCRWHAVSRIIYVALEEDAWKMKLWFC